MSRNDWRCAILAVLCSTFFGCTGHSVTRVPRGTQLTDQQVYYALPQTVLALEVPVTQETRTVRCRDLLSQVHSLGGLCAAGQTLRDCLELGPDAPARKFTSGEMVLSTRAEPDLDQIFKIDISSSALKKDSVVMKLSEAGLLVSGASESRNRAAEIGVGLVKSLAGIAGSLITRGAATPLTADDIAACLKQATTIREIRKQREDLLTRAAAGTAPPADTLKLLLDRGEVIEARLLPEFVGKVESTSGKVQCDIRPQLTDFAGANELTRDLFRFSKSSGIRLIDSNCRAPQGFLFAEPVPVADAVTIRLQVERIPDQYSEILRTAGAGAVVKDSQKQGFYFRIPADAKVKALIAKTVGGGEEVERVLEDRKLVSQLGVVTALPRQRSVYTKYDIALFESSGALQTLTTNTEGIDPASVTGVVDAAKTVVDAEIKKEQTERAAADELAKLERERKILEERKKIEQLRNELGLGDQ